MPLYSYRCNACGVQTDRKQGFNDPPLEVCPECGERELRKIYSPVGILFKGPGFYATDSRSASEANGKPKEAKTEPEQKTEAKSEKSKDKPEVTKKKED